jgi:hypothetical protein
MADRYWAQWDLDELKAVQGADWYDQIPKENDEDDLILSQSDYPLQREPRLTAYDIDMLTWRDFL